MNGKEYYESKVDIDKFKNKKEAKPWDLLNTKSEYVLNQEREKRYSICQSCDKFIKLTTQCKECGCFMKLKTKLYNASCPLGKW